MQLDVSKALNAAGQELPFSGEVVLSDSVLMGEPIVFPAPAALHGLYASVGDAIHVRGQMTFPVRARCVRCLTESERTLTADFDATFALSPDPTDPDLYAYDGDWVDLSAMAADAAQLALPMQWLCNPACKGLCPLCGANRNVTSCSCRMEPAKHPLSALQQLLTEKEGKVEQAPQRREAATFASQDESEV